MNMIRKQIVVAALALGSIAGFFYGTVRADIPDFATELDFCGANAVWDITGSFAESFSGTTERGDSVTSIVFLDLFTTAEGNIVGTASYREREFESCCSFDVPDVPIEGKIKVKDGITRLKLQGSGTGFLRLDPFPDDTFFVKLGFKGEIVAPGIAVGTWTFKPDNLRYSSGLLSIDLGNDGAWTLFLDTVTPDGKALDGSAEVELATGRILEPLFISGKYSSDKNRSKIKVRGAESSAQYFNKLKLKNLTANSAADTITGGEIKYKILGQKGKLSVSNACP